MAFAKGGHSYGQLLADDRLGRVSPTGNDGSHVNDRDAPAHRRPGWCRLCGGCFGASRRWRLGHGGGRHDGRRVGGTRGRVPCRSRCTATGLFGRHGPTLVGAHRSERIGPQVATARARVINLAVMTIRYPAEGGANAVTALQTFPL